VGEEEEEAETCRQPAIPAAPNDSHPPLNLRVGGGGKLWKAEFWLGFLRIQPQALSC
jgi:hypothetical protein